MIVPQLANRYDFTVNLDYLQAHNSILSWAYLSKSNCKDKTAS